MSACVDHDWPEAWDALVTRGDWMGTNDPLPLDARRVWIRETCERCGTETRRFVSRQRKTQLYEICAECAAKIINSRRVGLDLWPAPRRGEG